MLFSLPTGTEMFHFPAFPPTPYAFGMRVTRHDSRRVPPFGHPGITARLTAPPGLSRPPTSFIGPWYQGIHRPPLPTTPQHTTHPKTNHKHQRCSRPLCKSQPTTNPHPAPPTRAAPAMPGTTTTTPHPPGRPRDHQPPPAAGSHATHTKQNTSHHGTVVPSEPQQGV
jgi:hypothetical protein